MYTSWMIDTKCVTIWQGSHLEGGDGMIRESLTYITENANETVNLLEIEKL